MNDCLDGLDWEFCIDNLMIEFSANDNQRNENDAGAKAQSPLDLR